MQLMPERRFVVTSSYQPANDLLTFIRPRQPRCQHHNFAPLVKVSITHQQAQISIIKRRLRAQKLLKRSVCEVHLELNRFSQNSVSLDKQPPDSISRDSLSHTLQYLQLLLKALVSLGNLDHRVTVLQQPVRKIL